MTKKMTHCPRCGATVEVEIDTFNAQISQCSCCETRWESHYTADEREIIVELADES